MIHPDRQTRGLLFGWLFFAVFTLIVAGLFAILVIIARTPFIHYLLPGADYVRIALVGHVTHSFIIWFLAYEGLLWILTSTVLLETRPFSITSGWIGFSLAVTGTSFVITSALLGLGEPLFINYIPVLTHPLFYAGLLTLTLGITVTLINTFLTIWRAWKEKTYSGRLPLFTFGMLVSGIALFTALSCFGLSWYFQTAAIPENNQLNLELLFWGGGHVLQFTNTISMVTVWIFLTHLVFKNFAIRDTYSRWLYRLYLIFIIPAPLIYFIYDPLSQEHIRAFTLLMEYGLGPSTLIFAIGIIMTVRSGRIKPLPWNSPEFSSLVLSMALFALGGLISFSIYGYDTKIPSHYHGEIGGITLAFMGMTHHILELLKRECFSRRIAMIQPYIYGGGQALFVLGLFWAGSHGVSRKTFGAAQNLDSTAKLVGMIAGGLGGMIAILGGVLFIINALLPLIKTKGHSPL